MPGVTLPEGLEFKPDFSDQTGLFNPDRVAETVNIIGAGGIGASILPTLLTMGFKRFILFDPDVIEPRNITTNLIMRPKDLMRSKVERIQEYLLEFGAESVEIHQENFTGQVPLKGIVISGVDSMKSRKEIWPHIAWNSDVVLYMDGRIGGEFMTLLTLEPFRPAHVDWYEKYQLRDDSKAAPLPCTARTIVYPAVGLGAHMAANLATWSRGGALPVQIDQKFGVNPFFQTVFLKGEDEN